MSSLGIPALLSRSSNSLSRDATLMSLKFRFRADPGRKQNPSDHMIPPPAPKAASGSDMDIPITDSTVLLPG